MANLSGTVKNTANVALPNRRVRVYRRDTGAMLGEALSSDGSEIPGDSQFASVTLLLPMNALPFVDASGSPQTVTNVGSVELSGVVYKNGGGAAGLFSGSKRLTVPSFAGSNLPGDFTVETWVYVVAFSPGLQGIFNIGQYNSSCMWRLQASTIEFWINGSQYTWAWTGPVGSWFHLAVMRKGSTLFMYFNGAPLAGNPTNSFNIPQAEIMIGAASHSAASEYLNGYLDDLRLTKGVARYAPAFTPPGDLPVTLGGDASYASVGLLMKADGADDSIVFTDSGPGAKTITRQGTPVVDTAQSKFGGSSAYITGGNYLTTPAHADFEMGSGDFTVEAWLRFATTADMAFLGSTGNGGWDFSFLGAEFRLGRVNTAWDFTVAFTRTIDTWYHVAVVRQSGKIGFFVDGDLKGMTSNTNAYSPVTNLTIGSANASERKFNGWIDDLRVTKGVARYPLAFTPPEEHHTSAVGYTPDVGDFTIPVGSFSGESTVIIYDEDAGSKNAIVYDRVIPV